MSKTNDFITKYEKMTLQITGDIKYDVRDVIEDNERLFHGKFKNQYFPNGLKKIFFNVAFALWRSIMMNTDIDTKDLNFKSGNGKFVELIQMLKMWVVFRLQRNHFGSFLNELRQDCLKQGTVVVKVVGKKLKKVNLLNLIVPPHLENLQEGEFVEQILYSWEDMQKFKDQVSSENWSKIEDLWKIMQQDNDSTFIVYEHWTHIDIEGKSHKGCIKSLDMKALKPDESNSADQWDATLELDRFKTPYKRETDEGQEELYPYKELHFIKAPGRWLAFGVFEILKGLMEYMQEKWGLYRRKDMLDLKGIFKHFRSTKSGSVTQDFLNKIDSGTVMELEQGEDLERLVIDTKTGEHLNIVDKIFEIMQMMIGISQQGASGDLPASSTATAVVANKQTQQSTYDYFIEQQGIFITELFNDFYMNILLEDIKEDEFVPITGDAFELVEMDKFFIENLMNQWAMNFKNETGMYPTEELYMAEKERLMADHQKHGDMRFVQLVKALIKNLKYYVQVYVTNEPFDVNVQLKQIQESLLDPNYTGSRKKLYDAKFELMGMNAKRFEKSFEEEQKEKMEMQEKAMIENGMNTPPPPMSIPNETQQYTNANIAV